MSSLKELLYEKMSKEYEDFIDELKEKPFEDALEFAYQLVYKKDILMCFEDTDYNLPDNQVKALLKLKCPLDMVYQGWLKYDDSPMERIRNCIEDFAQRESQRQLKSKSRTMER